MGTEVWVLTRTMTDNCGNILNQLTSVYSSYDSAKEELRDIIDTLVRDYDNEHDKLDIAPLSAKLTYGKGGTDSTTVRLTWVF